MPFAADQEGIHWPSPKYHQTNKIRRQNYTIFATKITSQDWLLIGKTLFCFYRSKLRMAFLFRVFATCFWGRCFFLQVLNEGSTVLDGTPSPRSYCGQTNHHQRLAPALRLDRTTFAGRHQVFSGCLGSLGRWFMAGSPTPQNIPPKKGFNKAFLRETANKVIYFCGGNYVDTLHDCCFQGQEVSRMCWWGGCWTFCAAGKWYNV